MSRDIYPQYCKCKTLLNIQTGLSKAIKQTESVNELIVRSLSILFSATFIGLLQKIRGKLIVKDLIEDKTIVVTVHTNIIN